MIGGIALREMLLSPDVARVTVVGRRATGRSDPKLREILHQDFTDYGEITEAFENQDVALFCLGAYTGAVPDDELRRVTVDTTKAFAQALRARSPQAVFCFLSGQGADPTGRSRIAFARYKGAAENALVELGFPRVHIFRPGYIYPVEPRREPNVSYRIVRALYPVLRRVYPNLGIASDDLARAMVHAGLHGTGSHEVPVLENRDIRALAEATR
ncbi:MAG: hypothetical protein GY856_03155 [bacterium]|nr:hypothetical protein [bacterium]